MNAPAHSPDLFQYSPPGFAPVDDVPLPPTELSELVEEQLEAAVRASVCVTHNGGQKRTTLKPTIADLGNADALTIADALLAVAWSHCVRAGARGRYCAEMWCPVEGKARPVPHRVYFDLEPPGLEEHERSDGDTYVRALEKQNLRVVDRLVRQADRSMMRDGQAQQLAYDSIARLQSAALSVAALEVDKIEAESKAKRKEGLTAAVTRLLPSLARKYLGAGKPAAGQLGPTDGPPFERLRKYLPASVFEQLPTALGDELHAKLEAATSMDELRAVFTDCEESTAAAVVELVGMEQLAEIAGWE